MRVRREYHLPGGAAYVVDVTVPGRDDLEGLSDAGLMDALLDHVRRLPT